MPKAGGWEEQDVSVFKANRRTLAQSEHRTLDLRGCELSHTLGVETTKKKSKHKSFMMLPWCMVGGHAWSRGRYLSSSVWELWTLKTQVVFPGPGHLGFAPAVCRVGVSVLSPRRDKKACIWPLQVLLINIFFLLFLRSILCFTES